jgi:LuxR family maltose regulon positive regulatory protein
MRAGTHTGVERRRIIERPRLLRLLDETDARIILLVAPAGYGKTTLARQWLATQPSSAWLRVTGASTDPAAFASTFARAAGQIVSGAGTLLLQRLHASDLRAPSVGELADFLADDLGSWPADGWLGIDDHQLIAGTPAEDLLAAVVERTPIRLVVATRSRPAWTTVRSLVYGEVVEFGQDALTFTSPEALELLTNRPRAEARHIHEAARGWPAVIGLAGLTTEAPPLGAELPDALHQYFAEELLEALPDAVRADIVILSVAPSITVGLIERLFPDRHETVIDAAVGAGFLQRAAHGEFELHPLLRAFLVTKLVGEGASRKDAAIAAVTDFFFEERSWDDVFSIAREFSKTDVLLSLLEQALNECLVTGRLTTVAQWADEIASQVVESTLVKLARSEIDFSSEVAAGTSFAFTSLVPSRPGCSLPGLSYSSP